MNPSSVIKKSSARAALVLAAMAILLLATGCGSNGGNNGGGGGGGGNTGFSKSSLNGHYAFTLRGFGLLPNSISLEDYFVEGGVFTADGNGNITAGTEDYVQDFVPYADAITGTYTVNSDGSGDLRLNRAGGAGGRGGFTIYRITLSDTGHFNIIEDDGGATSAGSGEKQDSNLFTTTPSGTFVIRNHDLQVSATMAKTTISGTDVSGSFYMNQEGQEISGTFSGAGNGIGTPVNGRGSMTYLVNGTVHNFFYYVVSTSKFQLIDVTPGFLSVGLAEKQTGIFSNVSLSGSYAFGSTGDSINADLVNTVGSFTADGNAGITNGGGSIDQVFDGSVASNVGVTGGNYSINSDGFGTLSLTTAQGSLQNKIWMVSPSRAYFVAVDGINAEDGTIDLQSGNFTNASLTKQAGFFMDGFDGLFKDRVGTLTPNGSGVLSTSYASSFFDPNAGLGGSQPNSFSGSYSVGNNGRVTTQLNGFTDNIVLYLVSNSTGYMLQADAGVNISGSYRQQTSP